MNTRLIDFLHTRLPDRGRGVIRQAIACGFVEVDGKIVRDMLHELQPMQLVTLTVGKNSRKWII